VVALAAPAAPEPALWAAAVVLWSSERLLAGAGGGGNPAVVLPAGSALLRQPFSAPPPALASFPTSVPTVTRRPEWSGEGCVNLKEKRSMTGGPTGGMKGTVTGGRGNGIRDKRTMITSEQPAAKDMPDGDGALQPV
jgi:hypothetical protein